MATAEIVAIGSELLLGQIVDTNSAWMAQRLTALGVNLYFKSVVGDKTSVRIRKLLLRQLYARPEHKPSGAASFPRSAT